MNKKFLKNTINSMMLSAMVGSPIVFADDIDIYLGSENDEATVNIIFMLDTSGSMTSRVSGTNDTRMRQAQDALKAVINDLPGDMRVGLGRYNTPAGSILTPALPLDQEIEVDITVQPSGRDDDAYQRVNNNDETIVNYDYLKFEPKSYSDDVKVDYDGDDAEMCINNSNHQVDGSYFEIPSVSYDSCLKVNAITFDRVSIPAGAKITSAVIKMVTRNASGFWTTDVYVEDVVDGRSYNTTPIYDRSYLPDSVEWNFSPSSRYEVVESSNLKDLVQKIVDKPDWNPDDNVLSFKMVSRPYDFWDYYWNGTNTYYTALNSQYKPEITVKWELDDEDSNLVGIRFDEIQIPSNSNVSSGVLRLRASDNNGSGQLKIKIQDDASSPYKEETNNISDRTTKSRELTFDFEDWNYSETRDFNVLPLIQDRISDSNWCGGDDLNFIITSQDAEEVYAVDRGASYAPSLSFRFLGGESSCKKFDEIVQIENHADDSQEDPRSGNQNGRNEPYKSKILTRAYGHSGYIFRDLDIPAGSKIKESYIQFTAKGGNNSSTTYQAEIYGVKSSEFPIPTYTSEKYHITRERGAWTSPVSWTIGKDPYNNKLLTTSDLSSIVQELVNSSAYGSASEKELEFILKNNTSKNLNLYSYDGNPAKSAKLVVRYQTSDLAKSSLSKRSGVSSVSSTNASATTVRDYLIQLIDQQPASGSTPIEGSLYEAGQYFKGAPVNYGRSRHPSQTSSSILDTDRISGEETYSGGNVVYPNGCSASNLSDSDCRNIYIDGNPVYETPMTDNVCESNNIILITDGYPTNPSGYSSYARDFWGVPIKNLIQNETGETCYDAWSCSNAWVSYMYNTDFMPEKQGKSNITTHIVGFTELDSSGKLRSLADNGGGVFVSSTNTVDLVEALNLVIGSIMEVESTLATPGVAVNQNNRTLHLSEIYYSVFQPSVKKAWSGNLKKYSIDSKSEQIVDKNGVNAVSPTTGFFEKGTTSYWSTVPDGGEVEIGGAANKQTVPRKVYTYTGSSSPVEVDLTLSRHRLENSNSYLTKEMFGNSSMTNEDFKLVKEWGSGLDVFDKNSNGSSNDSRREMGDPLHSRPIMVSYNENMNIVYVSTNEGYLHAIDSVTGEELFSFVPKELLPIIHETFVGGSGKHIYGLDSSWVAWRHDRNGDGLISESDGDKMYLYSGMRRGGNNFYALDVTNPHKPKLKFVKTPSSKDFGEMGQTWSEPVLTKIKLDDEEKVVILFGAGYDSAYDNHSYKGLSDSQGAAIYMLDAETGELVYKITGTGKGGDLEIPGLNYSIVSRPYFVDLDGSGYADRIYITDLSSQIFKINLNKNNDGKSNFATGKMIAKFGKSTGNLSDANNRHMYDAISIAPIRQGGEKYMGIVAGTGYRAGPLDKTREDVIVIIKDKEDYYEKNGQKFINEPIEFSDLADLTNTLNPENAITLLKGKQGYYLKLQESNGDYIGEKVTGEPIIYDNQVILNTYVPNKSSAECVPIIGYARGYQFDLHTGTPNSDRNEDGVISEEDRYKDNVSSGIASGSKLIYTEDGVLLLTNTKVEKLGDGGALGVSKKRWYIDKK